MVKYYHSKFTKLLLISILQKTSQALNCAYPGDDPNADKKPVNDDTNHFQYFCRNGFQTKYGESTIDLKCNTDTGKWGPVDPPVLLPLCYRIGDDSDKGMNCANPGEDPNAVRLNMGDGQVLYTCNDGFITSAGDASLMLQCDFENGLWGPVEPPILIPVCNKITNLLRNGNTDNSENDQTSCPDLPEIEFGSKMEHEIDGITNTYYTCNVGYCAKHARARTQVLQCNEGEWSEEPPTCEQCEPCEVPEQSILDDRHLIFLKNADYTATISCEADYLMVAGTKINEKIVECVEGKIWTPELPTCFLEPQVVCGDDYLSVVLNKNMLDSLGFTGGVNNLAMTGMDTTVEKLDAECFGTADSGEDNYIFTLNVPYTSSCNTHLESVNGDYLFTNKVVWKTQQNAIVRQSTVLEFTCEYDGIFDTTLQSAIKLAISTRQYQLDIRGRSGEIEYFTMSMSVYHNRDFSNLVDNMPVVHQGKRYFVELMLEETDLGTPFMKHCYASEEYVAMEQLKAWDENADTSKIKSFIYDGCPVTRTLTRLEVPPNDYTKRFSFVFPRIQIGLIKLPYMYIHCEIEMRPVGHQPTCYRRNAYAPGQNGNVGKMTDKGNLGNRQFHYRKYSIDENGNQDNDALQEELQKIKDFRDGKSGQASLLAEQQKIKEEARIFFQGRKRRSIDEQWTVGFGPMVIANPDNVDESDKTEVILETDIPVLLNDEGDLDFNNDTQGSNLFTYYNTFVSLEKDAEIYKDTFPKELMTESSAKNLKGGYKFDEKIDPVIMEEVEDAVMDVEIKEEELEEKKNYASKAIIMIFCLLGGGLVLFLLSLYIGVYTNVCQTDSKSAKITKRPKKDTSSTTSTTSIVISGPKLLSRDQAKVIADMKAEMERKDDDLE